MRLDRILSGAPDVFKGADRNCQPMEQAMKLTVVRYKTKPEAADENQRLVEGVFQELSAKAPDDARYMNLRLTVFFFHHTGVTENKDGVNPIPRLEAFRAFQAG